MEETPGWSRHSYASLAQCGTKDLMPFHPPIWRWPDHVKYKPLRLINGSVQIIQPSSLAVHERQLMKDGMCGNIRHTTECNPWKGMIKSSSLSEERPLTHANHMDPPHYSMCHGTLNNPLRMYLLPLRQRQILWLWHLLLLKISVPVKGSSYLQCSHGLPESTLVWLPLSWLKTP